MNAKTLAGGIALLALSLNAQIVIQTRPSVAGSQAQTFEYVSSFMTSDSKMVKGAPYSADTANESVQTLADGNRIVHKNSTKVYRDSEGRTRREQTLESLGPWEASGGPRQLIFINDPVAGVSYTLDPSTKTARKMAVIHISTSGEDGNTFNVEAKVLEMPGAMAHAPAEGNVVITRNIEAKIAARPGESSDVKKEQLGKRTFEGVEAEGTRTTYTIPAGKMGNERPIDVVTETWYSADLQMLVRSETRDPRMGNSTYTLSNINRNEQPHYLFEVPADYTLKEESARPVRIPLKKNEM